MKKEIVIYITKEIHSSGILSKFILSNSKNSYECWFKGLPPQTHGNEIEYHESFNGQLNQLLYECKLDNNAQYKLKVFYNKEYKTICGLNVEKNKDQSQSYDTTAVRHLAPMKEEEILYFMNLFDGYYKR